MGIDQGKSGVQSALAEAINIKRWILLADLIAVTLAFFLAGYLRYGTHWDFARHRATYALLPFLVGSWLLWTILFHRMKLDGFHGGWWLPSIASKLLLAVLGQMSLLLAAAYLSQQYVSRLALAYYGLLLFPSFLLVRYIVRGFLSGRHASGEICRVVIAGSDHIAREIASKLANHPEMLCRVVGLLFPKDRVDDDALLTASSGIRSEVSTLEVADLLDFHQVNELIVALPQPATAELIRLATQCQQRGIGVSLVPQPYDLYVSRPKLLDLDGLPILKLCEPSVPAWFLKLKRAFDIGLSAMLLLLSVPIILPSALVLRISRGRAFLWDVRCGQSFKEFRMLRLNVRRESTYKTRFEEILDRFSISELPQLWNVFKGEMSLVGPRPEAPARTRRYTTWEQHRLSVRPGMTGLAQISGLREEHSSEAKARLDLQYLLNPSLFVDLSILLQTVWTIASRPRTASHVLSIHSNPFEAQTESAPAIEEEVDPRADCA